MVRKIFKTGNSIVVALPKDVLDPLRLAEGAEVDIQLDQALGVITIAPAPSRIASRGVDEDFARQVSEFIDQYRPALEALARAWRERLRQRRLTCVYADQGQVVRSAELRR